MYLNGVVTTFRLDATDGGGKDMVLSTAERGVVSWFTMDMTPQQWLAYIFNWKQRALDFGIGVGVDFLMDGITGELSDALGDGAAREMRESMEDIIGDGAERTVRESAEEAAERGTRGITGELMDDFDEYEQFYEDLFERQRESFGEYDDFLDDLKELQRGELDGGNTGNLFEGGSYSGEDWYNYFVDTYGKENVQGSFFNEIKYEPTSGVNFTPTKGKTTTILGRYDMDTQYIFGETRNIKSLSYDGHEGGFNILNVPDDLSNVPGGDFWNDYNVPFLDEAIGRNDVFSLATEPNQASMYRINKDTGLFELSGFGKEIKYLESKGYVFDKVLMQMVPSQ